MWGIGFPNSKRWTWNSNNDAGEKAQGFASGLQQDERTRIWILHRARKCQEIESEMEERYANDDLEEFGPVDDVEGSQQTGAEVDV